MDPCKRKPLCCTHRKVNWQMAGKQRASLPELELGVFSCLKECHYATLSLRAERGMLDDSGERPQLHCKSGDELSCPSFDVRKYALNALNEILLRHPYHIGY